MSSLHFLISEKCKFPIKLETSTDSVILRIINIGHYSVLSCKVLRDVCGRLHWQMDVARLVLLSLRLGSATGCWKGPIGALALVVLKVWILELEETRYWGGAKLGLAYLQTLLLTFLWELGLGRVFVL